MPARRKTDPFASLLDAVDERARKAAGAGPIMGTVISTSPLTVELDTGQIIVNPVVLGG